MNKNTLKTLPEISRQDYWSQARPNGKHALIGRVTLAGWEGYYRVDVRDAYAEQVKYYACPTREAAIHNAAQDGATYYVSEF